MTTAVPVPDLSWYDIILINSSAGKDSQATLDEVVRWADAAGFPRSRIVVVHCDLGRVEWKGTRDLAEEQARLYGLRFEVVARSRDLLYQIEFERKMFPSASARYCTSDQKTGQVRVLMTKLVGEYAGRVRNADSDNGAGRCRACGMFTGDSHMQGCPEADIKRQVRILSCLGIRAQESPARAKKLPFGFEKASSTKTTRHVDRWLPIFDWTVEQVWERIRATGVPYHPAYDLGMERLSCCFCILAKKSDLVIAARHNPELAEEYVRVEFRIGHRFKNDLSMAEVVRLAAAPDNAQEQRQVVA